MEVIYFGGLKNREEKICKTGSDHVIVNDPLFFLLLECGNGSIYIYIEGISNILNHKGWYFYLWLLRQKN